MTENLFLNDTDSNIYDTESTCPMSTDYSDCKELNLYKQLYYNIFNRLSDIADLIEQIQKESEEIYISADSQMQDDPNL